MSIRNVLSLPLLAVLLLFGPAAVHAQQSDSAAVRAAFDSLVTAHTYTATLKNGQLKLEKLNIDST
ncbi:MAG: hypothetical protein ABEK84_07015, partial [Salinibacter sp.]